MSDLLNAVKVGDGLHVGEVGIFGAALPHATSHRPDQNVKNSKGRQVYG